MSDPEEKVEIVICMGSSCFSRGNNLNLELIRNFLEKHDLEAQIRISGHLCQGRCSEGPNLQVKGKLFSRVSAKTLPGILEKELFSGA